MSIRRKKFRTNGQKNYYLSMGMYLKKNIPLFLADFSRVEHLEWAKENNNISIYLFFNKKTAFIDAPRQFPPMVCILQREYNQMKNDIK